MRSNVYLLVTAILAFLPFTICAEDATSDLKQLAGDWKRVRLEVNGEVVDPASDPNSGLRIRGDKVQVLQDGKPLEGLEIRLTLISTADPKLIDVKLPDDRKLEGIYKLEGKRWTICIRTDTDVRERPVSFETKAGSSLALASYEKVE